MANEDDKHKKKSRKPSKKLLYFLIILIVVLAEGSILFYDHLTNENSLLDEASADYPILNDALKYLPNNMSELDNLTDLVNFTDSGTADSALQKQVKKIGKNSIGTVTREGPYGNENSSVKVAYILGQHPRESNAHDAIYNDLLNSSDSSRMNGQLLAQEFVVDDILKNKYDLAIDIHASNGGYVQDPYIFAPRSNDTVAYEAANNVTNALSYVIYYEPASYSSPQYSTIPIDDGGVPAIVFEMRGNPDHSLETEANQFIHVIDKLSL